MPNLDFTITPAAVSQLNDALFCLARFDENISIEANEQELEYIQNSAFSSIFKRRVNDKDKETSIEYCTFSLDAKPEQPSCRLIITLHCRFNVIKTYRLTYESGEILHATFDRANSPNHWTISPRTLRDVVEYFGPKTEHVDWSLQNDKVTFTSYTDKVQIGKEIIRQPTHTSVTLAHSDFDECRIEHGLHVSIPAKDFRSIVAHADAMRADVTATYSRGNRPMQITYSGGGLTAEFTVMTKGSSLSDSGGAGRMVTPARDLRVRAVSQQPISRASSMTGTMQGDMPPPRTTGRTEQQGTTELRGEVKAQKVLKVPEKETGTTDGTVTEGSQAGTAPPATLNPDSLFIPLDDDSQWDTPYDTGAYRAPEDDGFVTWDTGDANEIDPSTSMRRRLLDSEESSFVSAFTGDARSFEIQPTQRLSQVKGIFD